MPILKLRTKLFYGWVVIANLLVMGVAIWGIRFSFGVFFKSLESEFNLTRAATSAIFSTQMVLGVAFSILGGWAVDRYGPKVLFLILGTVTGLGLVLTSQTNALWQLFFTYSLFLAMGTTPIYVGVMSTASRWFVRKRGMALGIASSGAGLGPLVFAPFATYLIARFDWRTAYLVSGIIAWLMVVPLSRLLKREPSDIGALPDGAEKSSVAKIADTGIQLAGLSIREAFRTRSFWMIFFIFLLFAASLFLILTHLVPYAMDIGFSAVEAATLLSVAGAATIVGRVLLGIVSDRIGKKEATIICTLLHMAAMVWLLWAKELWMLYLFALAFGFAWGGMGPTTAALIGDTFGLGRIGAIMGMLDAGFNIGAAIGPIFGGIIFDLNQSYFIAFLSSVVFMAVATLLVFLVRKEKG